MVLVEIYVPALNRQYDFKLEETVYIADILEELGGMLIPAKDQKYQEKVEDLLLCSYKNARILPLDATLKQEGITNGARLVLL